MKYVMLYDIRSHYNVGAIFRTCDGAGVAKVFLAGYTPAPIDRFGRPVPEIHKTALGAERAVSFEVVATEAVPQCLVELKAKGVSIVVVEQAPRSTSLADFTVPASVLYIFGSETEGVPPAIIALADVVLELPMVGAKESLNVSVTAGIVLYHT
jgi:23S rRNA (guanosine2251-2'-O)-methyltransferase